MLKKNNRKTFIDNVIKHAKRMTEDIGYEEIYLDMGKVYIVAAEPDIEEIASRLVDVFGIVYVSICYRIDKRMDEFEAAVLKCFDESSNEATKTFKAHSKRSDKSFEIKSADLNNKIGSIVLSNRDVKVDVHEPDLFIYCDVKKYIYIYSVRLKARGGLPIGSNGKGLLLLSGGIDSPVAGYLMAKRGVKIDALHFHSYPFTSKRAEEKVHRLAKILTRYTEDIKIHSINLLPIQKEINKNCPEREMTIISRRFMVRIAREISRRENYNSIITGENLGQVASQTIDGLNVTNDVADMLVFRPLIGMDKVNIIDIAKQIKTFETSIEPFEDCCTVFLPKHPILRPKIEDINSSEEKLDITKLVNDAIESMEIINIK